MNSSLTPQVRLRLLTAKWPITSRMPPHTSVRWPRKPLWLEASPLAPAPCPSWASLSPSWCEVPSYSLRPLRTASRPWATPWELAFSAGLLPAHQPPSAGLEHHHCPHCHCKWPQGKEVAVICTGLGRGEYLGKLKIGQLDPEGSGHRDLAGATS